MIDRRAACRRLLWWQERAQLLPVGVGEDGQSRYRDGSWQLVWHRWSLTPTAQHMKALSSRLVLTPEAGLVQSPGLLLLRFAQSMQQATHLWHAQANALISSSAFFSCSRACLCSTTSAA